MALTIYILYYRYIIEITNKISLLHAPLQVNTRWKKLCWVLFFATNSFGIWGGKGN